MNFKLALSILIYFSTCGLVNAYELYLSDFGQNNKCVNSPRNSFNEQDNLFLSLNKNELCVFSVDLESGDYKLMFSSHIDIGGIAKNIDDQVKNTLHLDAELSKLFVSTDHGKLRIFDWNKQTNKFSLTKVLDETADNLSGERPFILSDDKRHLYFGVINRLVVMNLTGNNNVKQRLELPHLQQYEYIRNLIWAPDQSKLTVITSQRVLTFTRNFENGKLVFLNQFTELFDLEFAYANNAENYFVVKHKTLGTSALTTRPEVDNKLNLAIYCKL